MEKWLSRLAHNQKIVGSSPTPATTSALIAQLVEHLTFNQVVLGSSPSGGTNFQNDTTGYL